MRRNCAKRWDTMSASVMHSGKKWWILEFVAASIIFLEFRLCCCSLARSAATIKTDKYSFSQDTVSRHRMTDGGERSPSFFTVIVLWENDGVYVERILKCRFSVSNYVPVDSKTAHPPSPLKSWLFRLFYTINHGINTKCNKKPRPWLYFSVPKWGMRWSR